MDNTQPPQEDLIHMVGNHIVADRRYQNRKWDSLSIVANITPGNKGYTGYIYSGEEFTPEVPENTRNLGKLLIELQTAMTPPGAEPWKQALIHITKPGPKINIQFEYDDPKRWSLRAVSLDMSDYAESLRPPR